MAALGLNTSCDVDVVSAYTGTAPGFVNFMAGDDVLRRGGQKLESRAARALSPIVVGQKTKKFRCFDLKREGGEKVSMARDPPAV